MVVRWEDIRRNMGTLSEKKKEKDTTLYHTLSLKWHSQVYTYCTFSMHPLPSILLKMFSKYHSVYHVKDAY